MYHDLKDRSDPQYQKTKELSRQKTNSKTNRDRLGITGRMVHRQTPTQKPEPCQRKRKDSCGNENKTQMIGDRCQKYLHPVKKSFSETSP